MYIKQNNKIAIRSQHMIADALFDLMKTKPFHQITVTEICERALIGRKTFYRNFELREDVISFQLDLMCDEYQKEIAEIPLENQLLHHFLYIQKNADFFYILYKNGFDQLAREKFSIILPKTMPIWTNNKVEQEYRSVYIVAGIEAVQRMWISNGYKESIEYVVDIVRSMHEKQVPIE